MKRIYSFDVFKLLFAYNLALFHYGVELPPETGVTIQLFFIVSGFFLGKKFYSKYHADPDNSYDQICYTKDHIKSLYPHYIFSLAILTVYTLIANVITFLREPSINQIVMTVKEVYAIIPELFLVQNTGFFGGGTNYPLWQLCVMLISGYFIYASLHKNEKLSRELLFPAAILMIQAFLESGIDHWGTYGFFHVPILRALSSQCIGVLVYYLTTTRYYEIIRSRKILFNLASIFAFLSIFAPMAYHNIFLITFVFLLLAMNDPDSWINKLLNRKVFKHSGNLCYAVYLNHAVVIHLMKDWVFPLLFGAADSPATNILKHMLYVAVLTGYSFFTIFAVKKLMGLIRSKCSASAQKV